MKIKNIISFCIAALTAVVFTSCDKNADNVKMVRISGSYNGDIYAELIMPDYNVEQFNSAMNENRMPSICVDTIKGGEVELHFASDDMASFQINKISGIRFSIPFLTVSKVYGYAFVKGMYSGGIFADFFNAINAHYEEGKLNSDEFSRFVRIMETLEDTISIDNFSVLPFKMREKGSIYSTYDYEQNSVYVRAEIKPFTFTRKTNVTEALKYVEDHFAAVLTNEDWAIIKKLKEGIKTQGTISDASGWLTMSYSNYRPYVDFTIDTATGLIDVLSEATFGKYKLNDDYDPDFDTEDMIYMRDADGYLIPNKTLLIDIWYMGTMTNMDSFERIEE